MTTTSTVVPMGFASAEDSHRAIKDIILRQHRATPNEMGRGREALVNGIEACQRAVTIRKERGISDAYKPEVYLGAHPTYPNLFCIADNGCGMTFDEAERHLASIGCSGNAIARDNSKEQNELFAMDTNKGVGVKISLLPDNPGGLNYVSAYLSDSGTEVNWFKLGMDETQMPGFFVLGSEDGWDGEEQTTSVQLDWEQQKSDELNFKHIKKAGHGTVVTLFGNDRTGSEDTADNGLTFLAKTTSDRNKPDNDYSLLRWINCRFWSFDDVKVSVNLGKETRQALGAARYLRKAKHHDTVRLNIDSRQKVDVHWWVMPQDGFTEGGTSKSWTRNGHVAIKYKGELYWDPRDTYQTTKKHLKNFGIFAGWNSVVIYIDLDSLPEKKQQQLIATNESRTKLYYNREELDLATTELGQQMFELINCEDPAVKSLVDFMTGELPPENEDSSSDEELKKLFRSLSLFTPIERTIKQAQDGEKIADGEAETRDIVPEHHTDTKIKKKSAKAATANKGNTSGGVENWDNDLPRFAWSDEINPDQSVSYSRSLVEVFTQCQRFQYLLETTLKRVQRNVDGIPDGIIRQTTERFLKAVVKEQVLSYVFVTAGFAKYQKTSFQMIQRDACSELILESQLMLNASVLDRLTKSIQRALINGK